MIEVPDTVRMAREFLLMYHKGQIGSVDLDDMMYGIKLDKITK